MDTPQALKKLRETSNSINVQCTTLDDDLKPKPILSEGTCEFNGECYKCNHFLGYWTDDEPTFSFRIYEGFCDK